MAFETEYLGSLFLRRSEVSAHFSPTGRFKRLLLFSHSLRQFYHRLAGLSIGVNTYVVFLHLGTFVFNN